MINVETFATGIYNMTDKKTKIGSPEHLEQVRKKTAKIAEELLDPSNPPDSDEIGVLSGSEELLGKTDAELFPDELEEYTPEERRKNFKIHTQDKD